MRKSKLALVFVFCSIAAMADSVNGDLFFTTFNGGNNVHKVSYNFDGTTFSLGAVGNLAATPGADGIIFAPDGDLLVGGQGNAVHKVDPGTGTFVSITPNATAFHLALDPSGDFFYASSIPGNPIATVPLDPAFANGTAHSIVGDDSAVTSIAFVGSTAYYTTSGSGGVGSFGTIDLTANPQAAATYTTTRILASLPAAHGMVFDPFTGDLMLFGEGHITQIDPVTHLIVSDLAVAGVNFDQGAVDGKGHAFVASNTGTLAFVDYKTSGLINDAGNFFANPFLASALDDVAPLAGLGAPPPRVVPEPSAIVLLASALAGCALYHRYRRSRAI